MSETPDVSLEPGDFLYQSDQELFLAVVENRDDSVLFSVHGWREIDKGRLDEYLNGEHGNLYRKEDIDTTIEEKADDDTLENYKQLSAMLEAYERGVEEDGPADDFALDDTR